jgi:hypothetical protein
VTLSRPLGGPLLRDLGWCFFAAVIVSSLAILEIFDVSVPAIFGVVNGVVSFAIIRMFPSLDFMLPLALGFCANIAAWTVGLYLVLAVVRRLKRSPSRPVP